MMAYSYQISPRQQIQTLVPTAVQQLAEVSRIINIMLLRKERLTEIEKVRQKTQKWKDEVAKQMLEKEMERKDKYQREQEEARAEDEKIRKYQEIINNRIKEGGQQSKRGGREESKSLARNVDVGERKEGRLEKREDKFKSHNSSKRKLETNSDEEIPLFPEIEVVESRQRRPSKDVHIEKAEKADRIDKVEKSEKQKQNSKVNQNKQQVSAKSIQEPVIKKRRKSTALKRQDTVESINLPTPDKPSSVQVLKLQEQNRKLKQELQKKNQTVQSLLKLIKAQHTKDGNIHHEEPQSQSPHKQIGFTEYIKMDPEARRSPPKMLFPSLNFKDAPIIFKFNLAAAKKAHPSSSTAQFAEKQQ